MTEEQNENRPDRVGLVIPAQVRVWMAVVGFVSGAVGGFFQLEAIEGVIDTSLNLAQTGLVVVFAGILGTIALAVVIPLLIWGILSLGRWVEGRLTRIPLGDIVVGVIGLIFGLIIANLLGAAFTQLPLIGGIASTIGAIIFGYLGWIVAVNKKPDMVVWAGSLRSGAYTLIKSRSEEGNDRESQRPGSVPKIVDSSAIIDGRIADVCRSGFLEGPLVIPQFILEEVQHIADSSDAMRRGRGRRGLDILNTIQKDLDIEVQICRPQMAASGDVDAKLLQLAREMDGKILTNDYNLNKVAVLQGVQVLNINDLANALKPMVIPGEELTITLIKEGKEQGQGVGYLDDGTMVVVDDGSPYIGEKISVSVTSVLQTSAGRMIFARPNELADAAPD